MTRICEHGRDENQNAVEESSWSSRSSLGDCHPCSWDFSRSSGSINLGILLQSFLECDRSPRWKWSCHRVMWHQKRSTDRQEASLSFRLSNGTNVGRQSEHGLSLLRWWIENQRLGAVVVCGLLGFHRWTSSFATVKCVSLGMFRFVFGHRSYVGCWWFACQCSTTWWQRSVFVWEKSLASPPTSYDHFSIRIRTRSRHWHEDCCLWWLWILVSNPRTRRVARLGDLVCFHTLPFYTYLEPNPATGSMSTSSTIGTGGSNHWFLLLSFPKLVSLRWALYTLSDVFVRV